MDNFKPLKFHQGRLPQSPDMIRDNNQYPLSDRDELKLKKTLAFIRAYYIFINDDSEFYKDKIIPLYLKLNYFNDLLNRTNLFKIEGLSKNRIIPILLDLSTNDHKGIRDCSLSILASLTYFIADIVDELIENNFYDLINMILQLPFYLEKRHVFRWIYNFVNTHKNLTQQFLENVLISDIYESSIDYLSNEPNTFCQAMFYSIILTKNITTEQIETCFLFFNYCLENPHVKGIRYVLLGIHKILSKTNSFDIDFLCKIASDLNIENRISYYIESDKINRKKCFSFCLLGDLFELGFQDSAYLIPHLLQIISTEDLTEWFLKSALKSIYKILLFCDQELVTMIFQTSINELITISTVEAYFCVSTLLNRVEINDILNFISADYMEYICDMILTDDANLIDSIISGFIRLVQAADMHNNLDLLSSVFYECDGFSKFDDRFGNDDEITPELINHLYETLDIL